MTTEGIAKGEEMIAVFMGGVKDGMSSIHYYFPNQGGYKMNLEYSTSYKELMPSIYKCLKICHEEMLDEWERGFSEAFLACSIFSLFKTTVSFITWYNLLNQSNEILHP